MKLFTNILLLNFNLVLSAAPDAGSLLNLENDRTQQEKLPKLIPKPIISTSKDVITTENEGDKIFVKEIILRGKMYAFSQEQIYSIIKADLNKELTFGQIQNLLNKIKSLYLEKGYFLINVTIPEQEVVNNTVIIEINEGFLDPDTPYEISAENLRIKLNIPAQYLEKAIGDKITVSRLERGILNLNDVPGISGVANLSPGSAPGSTKINLEIQESSLIEGLISADNYGSRYTGENRASGVIKLNNPTKFGDQITLSKVLSFDGNFDLNLVGYNFPLGRTGLRSNLYYSKLHYKIGKELETNPVSKGKADVYSAGLSYPIYNTSRRSVFLRGAYNQKDLYNENIGILVSDKTLVNQEIGLVLQNADNFITPGFTQILLSQSFGDLDLTKVPTNFAVDQAAGGAKTNGNFEKFNAQLFRIQEVTDKLKLQVLASAQFVDKNVDSAEDFSLGGPIGVRAYPSGEAAGDEGVKFSIDAQYNLASGTKFGNIILSTFYDYGEIKQYKDTYDIIMTSPNKYSLEGWGVALDLITLGRLNLKVIWADAIGENPGKTPSGMNSDGLNESSRIWAMARISF